MYFQIVFVLDNPDQCRDILDAWENAGIRGVTILESSGLGRVRRAGIRDDLPLIPSLSDLFMNTETQHRTLFTVVKSQSQIEAIVKATKSVVGDLEQPDTGFLFVVPVSQVYGISKLA
ncbi:MAG TPA: P-II family nitrogen regulator [Anaerolineales bacterium]|nr:P-II family nitrogen regulator [Anaerolineales bacterium]